MAFRKSSVTKHSRPVFAFDIETTGLSPYAGAEIFAYALCDTEGAKQVYRRDTKNDKSDTIRRLKDFASDPSIIKIAHNLKFELSFMRMAGMDMAGTLHDTMIMSQLLNNIRYSHALDNLCADFCEYPVDVDKEVAEIGRELGSYELIPRRIFTEYQERDVERTMILFKLFWPQIEGTPLEQDYWNEIELIKVTQQMEQRGIKLHYQNCEELLEKLETDIERAERSLVDIVGQSYNMGSVHETGELLYDVLQFPVPPANKKKKSALRPTDKDAIQWLTENVSHPALDLVLQYRSASHGIGIIKSYLDCAVGGIVHPNIKTNHAQTGRESASNPNLQNVQKKESQKSPYAVPARKCFCPRDESFFMLVDYAGIEMRLIIDATQEEELVALVQRNGDPHKLAAEIFYGNAFDGSKKMRGAAKNAQFAKAYGAGIGKIAATLGIPLDQARPGNDAYNKRFPKIAEFTSGIAEQISEQGFVETPFGRKLSINPMKKYSGSNYLIQGTAAGILKRAQVRAAEYVKQYDGRAALLLPIHDEIIFEIHKDMEPQLQKFTREVSRIMTTMSEIRVPLDVEWKRADDSWNDTYDYKIKKLFRRR